MIKKFSLTLVLAATVGFTTFATATNVTLQYTGQYSGVGSSPIPNNIAIGPYSFKVNSLNTWLVCASSQNEITNNETWLATVYDINNITTNTVWPANPDPTQDQWNQAAWFALQLFKNPGSSRWQNDVWYALGLDAYSDPNFSQDLALYDAATNNGTNLITWVRFYIPVPGSQPTNDGIPQPFIGTPEPSSFVLLGFGLLGTWRLRRNFRL